MFCRLPFPRQPFCFYPELCLTLAANQLNAVEAYSLFDLNEYIRRVLALNFTEPVWIICEINEVNYSRGHYYLDLVQKSELNDQIIAQAQAMLWAKDFIQLRRKLGSVVETALQEGLQIRMAVRVQFHERYGLKLQIEDIDPAFSLGQIALRRRQIIAQLQQEGLLHRNKQLTLPRVVQRLAVVSSRTAAGLQDFAQHLQNNPYGYRFHTRLFHTAMQGNAVEKELKQALLQIHQHPEAFDAVVILRGGGSKLDLAAFDSLELSRQIASFPLPVLTGIGHDIDETVVDLVAHQALKTPTAVADFLIENLMYFEQALLEAQELLSRIARQRLHRSQLQLQGIQQQLRYLISGKSRENQLILQQLQQRLAFAARQHLKSANDFLQHQEAQIHLLSPQVALNRGYSLLLKDEKIVRSTAEVHIGDVIIHQLRDGRIQSTVNNTYE